MYVGRREARSRRPHHHHSDHHGRCRCRGRRYVWVRRDHHHHLRLSTSARPERVETPKLPSRSAKAHRSTLATESSWHREPPFVGPLTVKVRCPGAIWGGGESSSKRTGEVPRSCRAWEYRVYVGGKHPGTVLRARPRHPCSWAEAGERIHGGGWHRWRRSFGDAPGSLRPHRIRPHAVEAQVACAPDCRSGGSRFKSGSWRRGVSSVRVRPAGETSTTSLAVAQMVEQPPQPQGLNVSQ